VAGCSGGAWSQILPSLFGEEAMFGQTERELREEVYGHISIDLPSTFTNVGTVEVMWSPSIIIPDMEPPLYLVTTVYVDNGVFYMTQWTQLETTKYYFKPLTNESTERWDNEWQVISFAVPSTTANHEYAQYFDYIKMNGLSLSESYNVTVYAKRFSGRIMIRVLEFMPEEINEDTMITQFNELYPLVSYKTVVNPEQ